MKHPKKAFAVMALALAVMAGASQPHAAFAASKSASASASTTAVHASPTSSPAGSKKPCGIEGAAQTMIPVRGKVSVASYQKRVRAEISSGKIRLKSKTQQLDFNRLMLYRIIKQGTVSVTATVPITGAGESRLSALTVVYHARKIDNYAEVHVRRSDRNTFRVATYSGGKMVHTADTGIAWMTDQQLLREMRTSKGTPSKSSTHQLASEPSGYQIVPLASRAAKVACIAAVLGISGRVAAILLSLCSGACSTAANPASATVCAACVTGIVAAGGAAITGVISCFKL